MLMVGTLGFYSCVVILLGLILLLIENQKPIFAGFVLLGASFLYWTFWDISSFKAFQYLANNPSAIFSLAISFIAVGIVYSFLRWHSLLMNARDEILDKRADIIDRYSILENTQIGKLEIAAKLRDHDLISMRQVIRGTRYSGYERIPESLEVEYLNNLLKLNLTETIAPVANDHKTEIISWIIYWPFSLLWYLIDDPLKKFGKFLYRNLVSIYDKMSKRMFADLD